MSASEERLVELQTLVALSALLQQFMRNEVHKYALVEGSYEKYYRELHAEYLATVRYLWPSVERKS